MVCNVKATKRDLAKVDENIQALAAKVAAYRVEIARWGPVEETDTRFDGILAGVRADADQITAEMAEHQRTAIAHMDDHARAWIAAGMPEQGEDREAIQNQEEIRLAWRDRIEALGSVVRDLERARPKIKVAERAPAEVPVDLSAVIKQALGGRS